MKSMFSDCSGLTTLDVSNFDTGNVTNMMYMFNGCEKLESLNLVSFSFDAGPTTLSMFKETCKSVTNKPVSIYVTAEGKNYIETKRVSDINNSYAVLTVYDESGFGVPDGENNGDENWKN
jgi:surface protein